MCGNIPTGLIPIAVVLAKGMKQANGCISVLKIIKRTVKTHILNVFIT